MSLELWLIAVLAIVVVWLTVCLFGLSDRVKVLDKEKANSWLSKDIDTLRDKCWKLEGDMEDGFNLLGLRKNKVKYAARPSAWVKDETTTLETPTG